MNVPDKAFFHLKQLRIAQAQAGEPYHEFLRVPSMSAGIYQLAAGAVDRQQPHTEDELYLVTAGRGVVSVGEVDQPVEPGSLVFVAAHVPHRFHSMTEDLTVLVLFSPAEYSAKDSAE
ncbi:MAG: cupin protein [Brevibacillus sp.]|nr:cupin protein [Brevibacillus sp.]